ncbi:MAG TPA: enoyl-CoA hydratase/isomerase family protein [Mycobacteriales bacterium]|nr:enoyl-CoA hydratase/isomerase family protein [Mycobacteriales bacterium]
MSEVTSGLVELTKEHRATAVRVDGAVAWITIGNAATKHAIGSDFFSEMLRLMEAIDLDESIRVVVLVGEAGRFSTGGDIRGMADRNAAGTTISDILTTAGALDYAPRLYRAMLRLGQPIIACVTGDAVGAGATLAMHCDIVLAAASARFGDPHVRLGLAAPGAYIWPRSVAVNVAKEYLLTGDLLSAQDAHRVGIANHVYDDANLIDQTTALAGRLASGAPHAIRWTKRLLNAAALSQQDSLYEMGLAHELLSMTTDDHREAVDAFVNRRPAQFHGK